MPRRKKKSKDKDILTPEQYENEIHKIEYDTNEWKGFEKPKGFHWSIIIRECWRDSTETGSRTNGDILDGSNEIVFRLYTLQEFTAKNWFTNLPDYLIRAYPFSENYYKATLYKGDTVIDTLYLKGGAYYANRRKEAEKTLEIRRAVDRPERHVTRGTSGTEPKSVEEDNPKGSKPKEL